MVTMVSFFWKAFAAMATGETAARRVARIIDMEIAKEELVEEYKGMCLLLAEKIVQHTCAFKRRFTVGDLSLEELQAKNNDFLTYKKGVVITISPPLHMANALCCCCVMHPFPYALIAFIWHRESE
jgi:hypothetical protein